jgi:hypothetical protein
MQGSQAHLSAALSLCWEPAGPHTQGSRQLCGSVALVACAALRGPDSHSLCLTFSR